MLSKDLVVRWLCNPRPAPSGSRIRGKNTSSDLNSHLGTTRFLKKRNKLTGELVMPHSFLLRRFPLVFTKSNTFYELARGAALSSRRFGKALGCTQAARGDRIVRRQRQKAPQWANHGQPQSICAGLF